jgi:hypothetical protein
MSSAEKKTIDLKAALKDAAMTSAPSFPDFAQVYRKAEQRPRKVRRFAFSAAVMAVAAAASFWVGIYWHSQSSRDVALIDSWSTSASSVQSTVNIGTSSGQQSQVVLASSPSTAVNLFVQDLWESSSSGGL